MRARKHIPGYRLEINAQRANIIEEAFLFFLWFINVKTCMHLEKKVFVSKQIAFQVSKQKWPYLCKILKIQNAEKSRHSIRYGFPPRDTLEAITLLEAFCMR